jgi:bacillithiol system protein YtxJ
MNWNALQQADQLPDLINESSQQKIIIFKHSTRCSISRTTLDRLERNWIDGEQTGVKMYFLDLIAYRDVSNKVAEYFEVEHQSPQVLIISQGKSVYNRSHFDIDTKQIQAALKN